MTGCQPSPATTERCQHGVECTHFEKNGGNNWPMLINIGALTIPRTVNFAVCERNKNPEKEQSKQGGTDPSTDCFLPTNDRF